MGVDLFLVKVPCCQQHQWIWNCFSAILEFVVELTRFDFYFCQMILPIVAYGDPVLKKKAVEIEKDYPKLKELVDNMFETMHRASGVGLAAPQVGLAIRLFVIDLTPYGEGEDADPDCKDFKRVFINPIIYEEEGEEWGMEEGCLSLPHLRLEIFRKPIVKIEYYDENWDLYEEELDGFPARVVQHEYDHLEGILLPDRVSSMKRTLIKSKLSNIAKGNVSVSYKMKFANVL
jgi:peptide deformylase